MFETNQKNNIPWHMQLHDIQILLYTEKIDWDTTKQKMSSGFHYPLTSQSNILDLECKLVIWQDEGLVGYK